MPSQHTSGALSTEHNEAQREHGERGDLHLQSPQADMGNLTELSQGTHVSLDTDTSADDKRVKWAEVMKILEKIIKILDKRILELSDVSASKPELPFNPPVYQMDKAGYTPLYKAALEGDLEGVEDLISRGANPNKPSKDGLRPLHAAAQEGHTHIVDFLILQGADVNVGCDLGQTPLHIAASSGYTGIVDSLIAKGANVNKEDNTGRTPFNDAVKYGRLEAVKYLVTKGAKQNRYVGITPLYTAARSGHLDIVRFLVSKGADVNEEADDGMIPLHGAAARGHTEVMEYLIQQGSDVNAADAKGWTPLNAAVQNGQLEAVKYLLTEGAKQNSYDGMTPLYAAARSGHLDIVRFLVSEGADVNEEDDDGMIPLHGAAARGHTQVMEYLIQQGSDVNKADAKGSTPFNAAVVSGHLEAVKYLLTEGAKQNRYAGMTPLYAAAQFSHLDIVRFLVSNGADVNERNECGKSPLHAACCNGNMDIVKLLVHHNVNVNEQDHDGWKPLHAAAQEGHQDIVNYLALHETDMNLKDVDGFTPLQVAVNTCNQQVIEGISSRRDVPGEEETGDPRIGGHRNIITREYMAVSLKDADTLPRTGKLASQVDNAEDGNDCTQADNATRGADELSLKSLPTRTHDDEKADKEERNPFIQAKLKYHDEGEHDPMLNQMEAMKCIGTRRRDTITNGTDCSYPQGHQTWQYSGFDPPHLQTMEADGHPSEEPGSRCHSLIDENREMRESPSPMNVGNDLPINEPSVNFVSFPTHPPDVVHQTLYDGNPVFTHGTSSNPVPNIETKRRTSTFLQMIIALAIILAASPVLVAGSGIFERVTLQAGKPGVVPFHLPWIPNSTFRNVPYYTLGFQSEPRPFCINGQNDIAGFKNPSQLRRFTTSVTYLDSSLCVNLMIDNVDTLDEDGYVLLAVWHRYENVRYETIKKEIVVQIPPGPAKCFITVSENDDYPYEVHCRATTGSDTTTMSCYQNGQMIDVKIDITDHGLITSGIFWLPHITHFSCCSHYVSLNVSQRMCNDFEWPHGKETTRQTVDTVPTSVTTPTLKIESHTGSGACRQSMLLSLWYFTYLLVYLLDVVTT